MAARASRGEGVGVDKVGWGLPTRLEKFFGIKSVDAL